MGEILAVVGVRVLGTRKVGLYISLKFFFFFFLLLSAEIIILLGKIELFRELGYNL